MRLAVSAVLVSAIWATVVCVARTLLDMGGRKGERKGGRQ